MLIIEVWGDDGMKVLWCLAALTSVTVCQFASVCFLKCFMAFKALHHLSKYDFKTNTSGKTHDKVIAMWCKNLVMSPNHNGPEGIKIR